MAGEGGLLAQLARTRAVSSAVGNGFIFNSYITNSNKSGSCQHPPKGLGWGMEFCVLGLLMMRDLSLYDLNQAFKASLALFYSASLGSLQVALRNLEARGLVAYDEVLVGRRAKKVYRILPEGKQTFFSGFQEPLPPARLEAVALSRVHFLGLLPTDDVRRQALDLIVAAVAAALRDLEALEGSLQTLPLPESARPVFRYQMKTLDYGLQAHRLALKWFEELRQGL